MVGRSLASLFDLSSICRLWSDVLVIHLPTILYVLQIAQVYLWKVHVMIASIHLAE